MKPIRAVISLGVILLILSGCSPGEKIVDLAKEVYYAEKTADFVYYDYLSRDAAIEPEEGWTRLNENQARRGIFPRSLIRFKLKEIRPLYLYFRYRFLPEAPLAAEAVTVDINGKKIYHSEISRKGARDVKIDIPAGHLLAGDNTAVFHYHPSPGETGTFVDGSSDRQRSLIFNELCVTSLADKKSVDFYHRVDKGFIRARGDGGVSEFFQPVPSQFDFYLNLPAKSYFTAGCTFVPSHSPVSSTGPVKLRFIVRQEGAPDDKISTEIELPLRSVNREIQLPLPNTAGLTRFSVRTERVPRGPAVQGFIKWHQPSILSRKRLPRLPVPSGDPARLTALKESLQRMNVIFVIFDAARADHFSTYGHFRRTTPEVSAFAREGIVFTRAFSQALTTRCSISTLFTGFPLSVTSVYGAFSKLPPELTTLAQFFRDKGIYTACINGMASIASTFGFDRGFDEYMGLYRKDEFTRKSQEYIPYFRPWLTENKDRQFFLYLHFKEPHAVYRPVPEFEGFFSKTCEERVSLDDKVYKKRARSLTPGQIDYVQACYDETLVSVDSVFGHLIDHLRELGLLEKSLIILTADHGEYLGERKVFGHGINFHEEGIHIPLIIRWPRDPGENWPSRIGGLVKMTDLFATLSDIYEFDLKEDQDEGKSILPLLTDPEGEINPYIIVGKRGTRAHCIRTRKYKLIHWEDGRIEFYHLAADPAETRNVYKQRTIRARYMMTELWKWRVRQEGIKSRYIYGRFSEQAKRSEIDSRVIENLKALGYIDD